MEQPEISGLIGERLREAGQARNLSVNALTPSGEAPSSGSTDPVAGLVPSALPSVPALARGLRSGVQRLGVHRLLVRRGAAGQNRLLDVRTEDGVTTEIRALDLVPGPDLAVSGGHPEATAQLLVTAGRIQAASPEGALDLNAGEALTWDGDAEHRFTVLDGLGAGAVVVVHRPATISSRRFHI